MSDTDREKVRVIGGGLAGCEAAWQLAVRQTPVSLYEMRPAVKSPAHHTESLGELVCSNSFRAAGLTNAVGLLKEEMRRMGSLVMNCADQTMIPAGGALAVDREAFSSAMQESILAHPLIDVYREEVRELPASGLTVLATGPLTSPALAGDLLQATGSEDLYFYDAAAPLLLAESVDESRGFWASRYDKGDKDYFNCTLTKEEYDLFYGALVDARVTPVRDFEDEKFFEGCMPIEVLASRGPQTLLYGPMKPVGLVDPADGRRPYAVVQLRRDDAAGSLVNMVGFQTRLARPEQERILRMIPALKDAVFVRYGMMHRNMYINTPAVLWPDGRIKGREHVFVAGQMTGVEGYVESAASGLAAGIYAWFAYKGISPLPIPPQTALGSLLRYVAQADEKRFQPMNINFGLFLPYEAAPKDKKEKGRLLADRSLQALEGYMKALGEVRT